MDFTIKTSLWKTPLGKWKGRIYKGCLQLNSKKTTQLKMWPEDLNTVKDNDNEKDRQYQALLGLWSSWNAHTWLLGMWNDKPLSESGLAVSYKLKHTLTTWLSNSTSIYPREIKIYLNKDLHADVHGSFIYNSQKLETTQMPINK